MRSEYFLASKNYCRSRLEPFNSFLKSLNVITSLTPPRRLAPHQDISPAPPRPAKPRPAPHGSGSGRGSMGRQGPAQLRLDTMLDGTIATVQT